MDAPPRFRPFVSRPVRFAGVQLIDDYLLKAYEIRYGDAPFEWAPFAPGLTMARDALPRPARVPGRPGVGFCIAHRGNGADYVVLGWWDRENELPLRVFVREQKPRAIWRPAEASESVCVWDLGVIAFERDAYVDSYLNADAADAEDEYLGRALVVH